MSDRKIVDYKIVQYPDNKYKRFDGCGDCCWDYGYIGSFEMTITDMAERGWQPLGGIVIYVDYSDKKEPVSRCYQTMVKYE